MAHDVFISHAIEDKPTADAACATLEARRIRCWIAPRDVLPGMDYAQALVEAINQSRVMLLIFSARSNHSPHVRREVERAVSAGIPILPFRIEDVSPSPSLEYFIATAHWLDALTPPLERHLKHLAETVKLLLARIAKPEPVVDEAEAPEAKGTAEPTVDEATHRPAPVGKALEFGIVVRWGGRPIVRLAAVFGAAAGVVALIFLLVGWPFGGGEGSLLPAPTPGASTPTVPPAHPTSAAATGRPSATAARTPRVSPTAAPISTPTPVERSPRVLWSFKTSYSFSWGLVVVDGVVYLGTGDNYVYALDAVTGEKRWGFETGDDVESSPTVTEGTVYIGSDDHYVYALDAGTGEERWRFQTGAWVQFSPAVADGVVYVGSGDNYVYALGAATGEERWRFKTGYEGAIARLTSPAVADGVVYIGGGDDYLYALDGVTGELRWRREMYDNVFSPPVVVDGVVYAGTWLGGLRALDAGTGDELWVSSPSPSGSLAVADGVVYIGSDGGAYAVDAATGEERWRFQTGAYGWASSPTVADAAVYIGNQDIASNDYHLYALDAATGEERWRFQMGSQVVSSPAAANGVIYVGSQDGYLYALDTTRVEERWVPERPTESGP